MLKAVKYLVSVVLIFLVCVFIGELYSLYILHFQVSYHSTLIYASDGVSQQEMLNDIETAAKEHNVEVFIVNQNWDSLAEMNIDVYTFGDAKENLIKQSSLNKLHTNSLMLGKTDISIYPVSEIDDITQYKNFSIIGNKNDATAFKKSLIDKYAVGPVQEGAGFAENRFTINTTWAIVLSLILLLTMYEVALQKKEAVIKMVLGESLSHIVVKSILLDTVVFLSMFGVVISILQRFTNVLFYKDISLAYFLLFLICNGAIYISLLFSDYKQDMSSKRKAKRILNISYVYKAISIIFMVLVMAGFVGFISEGLNYYGQKEFFEQKKDYSYVSFTYKDEKLHEENLDMERAFIDEGYTIILDFYKQMKAEGKALDLVNVNDEEDAKGTDYIYCSGNVEDYLIQNIPEIEEKIGGNKIYFILPKIYEGNQQVLNDTLRKFGDDLDNYEILYYENTARLVNVGYTFDMLSKLQYNPIILLNKDPGNDHNLPYITQMTMYKVNKNELDQFIAQNAQYFQGYTLTNVYDNYVLRSTYVYRMAIFAIALLLILLLLEIFIIRTVLKYEYTINATEIILKKIHGENFFQRNKRILFTTFFLGMASLCATIAVNNHFRLFPSAYVIIGVCFILLIELVLIIYYATKLENTNIQKILKGGRL